MSDSDLKWRSPTTRESWLSRPALEDDDESARSAFGYLRGTRDRAMFVEFRLADGTVWAFPYSWMGPARFHPSQGIVLYFVGDAVHQVTIQGWNLNAEGEGVSLFGRGLLRHRIVWVREMSEDEAQRAAKGETVVEKISIRTPDGYWNCVEFELVSNVK
jgi:hypothetical protein